MTVFFLLVGLEIKRELVHGELSSPRRALLPAAGALGGMVAPALIYTAFNAGGDGARGWGVPMATDIAFAVGVLSLLGRRIPFSVKVFLLALAIADDIGAIVVIAVFYTADMDYQALGLAAATLALILTMNRTGVRSLYVYVALGAVLWLALLESGVHATIAGVILGLLTPASSYYGRRYLRRRRRRPRQAASVLPSKQTRRTFSRASSLQMEDLAQGTEAPLDRLERALHPWVSFLIVPLFALANAGVHISGDVAEAAIESPVSQGVALGLLLGKPLGIFLAHLARSAPALLRHAGRRHLASHSRRRHARWHRLHRRPADHRPRPSTTKALIDEAKLGRPRRIRSRGNPRFCLSLVRDSHNHHRRIRQRACLASRRAPAHASSSTSIVAINSNRCLGRALRRSIDQLVPASDRSRTLSSSHVYCRFTPIRPTTKRKPL